ncbi:MAG: hypothetical protein AB7O37_00950 [Vicinamibacteria bacterium]
MPSPWTLPPELAILGIVLLLCLAIGVPLIKSGIWLPPELQFQTLRDDELEPAQLAHYQRFDLFLQPAAYLPRFNFRVTNMQGPTLTRVYLADHDHAVLGAHLLRGHNAADPERPSAHAYLEWVTKHQDGTTLTTRNADVGDVFDALPEQVRQDCVGVADPLALKRHHDLRARELLVRGPVYAHGRDILGEFQEFHRRFCDFQQSRGLLTLGHDGRWHPTTRTALRGVGRFFNPFADNFTLPRFALALIVGAGPPLLAAWLTTPDAALRPEGLPVVGAEPLARYALLGVAYALGGAAVGWLFRGKAFIWALLLGYVPLRLLTPEPFLAVGLALWMGTVADWAARARERKLLRLAPKD